MSIINELIIDVGMHKGKDTEFYLKKGFKVVAVEANNGLVSEVEQRLSSYIKTGQLEIYNCGISDKCGVTEFYINLDKDDWSSIFKNVGTRQNTNYSVEEINVLTFDKILNEVGIPYYLKIDIEHADILALKQLHLFSDRPRYVSCEAHSLDIFFELKALGYDHFKLINQKNLYKITMPNPPLEGDFVDEKFSGIHSGPFGQETPGEWRQLEVVLYEWLHKRMGYPERLASGDGWFDVHAKLY